MAEVFDAAGRPLGSTSANSSTPPSSPAGVFAQVDMAKQQAMIEQRQQAERRAELEATAYRELWGLGAKALKPVPTILICCAAGLFFGWALTPRCSR